MNPSEPDLRRRAPDATEPTSPMFEWVQRTGEGDNVLAELGMLTRRRRRMSAYAVVSLIAVVATLGTLRYRGGVQPGEAIAPKSTVVVAAPAKMVLPDGSVVELRNDAELIPAYTADTRAVTLLKGTAYFTVSKDPNRPFIVTAGRVGVRAVGTAFSVEMATDSVDVLVTEGRVAVSPDHKNQMAMGSPASIEPALVSQGELLSVSAALSANRSWSEAVRPVAVELVHTRLSWRVPRLEFSGTPLNEVAEMFNQHNVQQLILSDPALNKLQFSGFLRADNLPALVMLLRDQFNVGIEYRGTNEIVLSRAL